MPMSDRRRGARGAGLALLLVALPAAAELPVPCSPCTGNIPWTSGAGLSPTQLSPQVLNGGRDMLILQGLDRQTYSWETFNIGRGHSVEFRQPASDSVALNRVLDPAQRLSVIEGALKANGQVYLVNRNGVLFRRGASVDVNTLLASSLDLNQDVDGLFEEIGIGNVLAERISIERTAALVDELAGLPGDVTVENGAVVEAGRNGRIILVGANVENRGVLKLSGPGGQALLIAGEDRVYFFEDDGARGLGVELGTGGTVANVGSIIAGNGNVTLAGLTVNQRGVVRATTAVSANGTVRLQARDGAFGPGAPVPNDIETLNQFIDSERIATRSGTVTFGPASVTEIRPEVDSADAVVDEQAFLAARVEVRAQDITLERDARITVPAGEVELLAADMPQEGNASRIAAAPVGEGTIRLERGARIDVSGLENVSIPASRNVLELQLRRAELSASTVNRDGPLLGETIRFDLRNAPAFVDVSGAVESVARGIAERSTPGGDIRLYAGRAVDIARGAVLDASGGSVAYTPSRAEITRVMVNGQIADLSDVGPNTRIDGVVGSAETTDPRWGFTSRFAAPGSVTSVLPGYLEGKDAGTIEITSLNLERRALNATLDQLQIDARLDGSVLATTFAGDNQRRRPGTGAVGFARPFDEVPLAGTLLLGLQRGGYALTPTAITEAGGASLDYAGFARLELDVGAFALPSGVVLDLAGGTALDVTVRTGGITLAGDLRAPGGSVSLLAEVPDADLVLAPGATLDLSGRWVDERTQRTDPVPEFIDGGSVTFTGAPGGAVTLSRGARIDVGGGASLGADGALTAGRGGSLAVNDGVTAIDQVSALDLGATVTGHVFAGSEQGARFALTARNVTLAPGSGFATGAAGVRLGPAVLTGSGFTDFDLTSSQTPLVVEPGFDVRIVPEYRVLRAGPRGAASDTPLDELSVTARVDNALQRAPTSLALTALQPDEAITTTAAAPAAVPPGLVVGRGTRIETDIGGRLDLAANASISLGGRLAAPAGDVSVDLLAASPGFDRSRGIWLLDGATIDVGGVLRPLGPDPVSGLARNEALDAGTVRLRTGVNPAGLAAASGGGFILGYPGAQVDLAGVSGTSGARVDGTGAVPAFAPLPVEGDAGRLVLEASHGVQFFADVDARAGPGARAGSLELVLDADRIDANINLAPDQIAFPILPSARIVLDGEARMPAVTPLGRLDAALFGVAALDVPGYTAAGFERLSLSVFPNEDQINPSGVVAPVMVPRIDLVGDLRFDAGRELALLAPVVHSDGGAALLGADYLTVGYRDESNTRIPTDAVNGAGFAATAGTGSVVFAADFIDLTGLSAFRGFGTPGAGGGSRSGLVAFVSATDIRLNGMLLPDRNPTAPSRLRTLEGHLAVPGDVVLQGQRVYGSTLGDFTITSSAGDASINVLAPTATMGDLDATLGTVPGEVRALLAPRLGRGTTNDALPLSAGSHVTLAADVVRQHGRLLAPFGALTLDAQSRLELGAGSVTSVTGAGLSVPFGETVLGDWVFSFASPDFTDFTLVVDPGASDAFALPLPEKAVRLVADGTAGATPVGVVALERGATLDVRGGGTLFATEFIQGPIGKTPILDAARGAGAFALLPAGTSPLAPLDPVDARLFEYGATARFEVTDGGTSGIAAGTYAVLPPRYALLDGAFLLTREPGGENAVAGASALGSADGLPLLAGAHTELGRAPVNTTSATQYRVETARAFLNRAEYVATTATDFFPAQAANADRSTPLLPRDAGAVQILPNLDLVLGGTIARGGVDDGLPEGLGSRVDIAADEILIAARASAPNPAGAVLLTVDGLRALNAESLLIGGTRSAAGDRTVIDDVRADAVTVADGTSVSLENLTLVAQDDITLGAGSRVSDGGRAGAGRALARLDLAGDAAIVRVGGAALPIFSRVEDGGPTGQSSVTLGAGATLSGSGSVLVDATRALTLDGRLDPAAGSGLHVGAPLLGLGPAQPGFGGTVLDGAVLGGRALDELALVSADAIRLFGDFTVTAERVQIDAAGLRGEGDPGAVFRVATNTLTLANTAGRSLADPTGGGAGRLRIDSLGGADSALVLHTTAPGTPGAGGDAGDFDVVGFANAGALPAVAVSLGQVRATGDHELAVTGDLALTTGRISAAAGRRLAIGATGHLGTAAGTSPLPAADPFASLGARIDLGGRTLTSAAPVVARSGSITLRTTGSGDGDALRVAGRLDASGLADAAFGPARVSSAGGRVTLASAGTGTTLARAALVLAPGAELDVSGGLTSAAGGILDLAAPGGAFDLGAGAVLAGRDPDTGSGSVFRLDAGHLPGGTDAVFDALTADGAGFTGEIALRLRAGDVTLDGGRRLAAGRLAVTADAGAVTVGNATLDASGWWGGEVALNGGTQVVLGDGARVLARATGAFARADGTLEDGVRGGTVALTAATGSVSLDTGAQVDVRGTRANATGTATVAADTGRVRLTARRIGNDLDLAAPLDATFLGAGRGAIELVAHRTYTPGTAGSAAGEAAALTAAQGTVLARLGVGGDERFRVAPGVEIGYGGGDLSGAGLNAGLLDGLFDAGTVNAGVLTVRADAALDVNLSVRDGLVSVLNPEDITRTIPFPIPLPQTEYLVADDDASWTLQLVAGADTASADLLATGPDAHALSVAAGTDIVTGSGDIRLVASGDVTLADNANVLVAGRHDDLATYTGTIDDVTAIPFASGFFVGSTTPAEDTLPGTSFPDTGGDLLIRAGGSLETARAGQFVSEWMTRTGMPAGAVAADLAALGIDALEVMPSAWGVLIEQVGVAGDDRGFNQGFAAFGGGNIRVDVAGDVVNAAFSIPTTGRQVGHNTFGDANRPEAAIAALGRHRWLDLADDADDFTNEVDVIGGGLLDVRAGGSVSDVDVVVFRGAARVNAGGDVSLARIGAGDAGVDVTAGGGVSVGGYIDPMLLEVDESGVSNPTKSFVTGRGGLTFETAFFSYGAQARASFSAISGDVVLTNDASGLNADTQAALSGNILPGDVSVTSLVGGIESVRNLVFFPDADGTLALLGGGDLRTGDGVSTIAGFLQSDFERSLLPDVTRPANAPDVALLTLFDDPLPGTFGEAGHARVPVHRGDREPNLVVSRGGNVRDVGFRLAKRSVVSAARDIDSIDLVIQHPNEGDVSSVEAGRDIRFDVIRQATTGIILTQAAAPGAPGTNGAKLSVGGPGELHVLAGRDIRLGALNGIKSFGDEDNPVLPDLGADLLVFAGVSTAPDYEAFITRFIDWDGEALPDGTADAETIGAAVAQRIASIYADPDVTAADLALDESRRAAIRGDLAAYLGGLSDDGVVTLDPALSPVQQFRTQLTETQQRAFVLDVFFDELRTSSLEAADPASGRLNDFVRGRHAIATLFPADTYEGDVVSALSAVQTLDGGDIRLVAPGGTVDAGTTAQTTVTKQPLNLGYVAFRAGAVEMFVGESINVNSTRIFTQQGGDVVLWADRGNIDAGRGQRDVVTLASTEPVFDEFLNFVDEPPISVSGSGIRTLAPAGTRGGSIFLAAPEGTIDAGDAGIESDSGLVLAAQEVANADFISAGGPTFSTVQVPTSVGASLGNLGDVSATATESVSEATRTAAAAAAEAAAESAAGDAAPRTRITVNVLSFGS